MNEEEDVEHVLLRCGAHAEERRKLWLRWVLFT